MTPQQHVLTALGLAALILIAAGDRWNARVAAFKPISATPRKT